jgi:hypothetical protein
MIKGLTGAEPSWNLEPRPKFQGGSMTLEPAELLNPMEMNSKIQSSCHNEFHRLILRYLPLPTCSKTPSDTVRFFNLSKFDFPIASVASSNVNSLGSADQY